MSPQQTFCVRGQRPACRVTRSCRRRTVWTVLRARSISWISSSCSSPISMENAAQAETTAQVEA